MSCVISREDYEEAYNNQCSYLLVVFTPSRALQLEIRKQLKVASKDEDDLSAHVRVVSTLTKLKELVSNNDASVTVRVRHPKYMTEAGRALLQRELMEVEDIDVEDMDEGDLFDDGPCILNSRIKRSLPLQEKARQVIAEAFQDVEEHLEDADSVAMEEAALMSSGYPFKSHEIEIRH